MQHTNFEKGHPHATVVADPRLDRKRSAGQVEVEDGEIVDESRRNDRKRPRREEREDGSESRHRGERRERSDRRRPRRDRDSDRERGRHDRDADGGYDRGRDRGEDARGRFRFPTPFLCAARPTPLSHDPETGLFYDNSLGLHWSATTELYYGPPASSMVGQGMTGHATPQTPFAALPAAFHFSPTRHAFLNLIAEDRAALQPVFGGQSGGHSDGGPHVPPPPGGEYEANSPAVAARAPRLPPHVVAVERLASYASADPEINPLPGILAPAAGDPTLLVSQANGLKFHAVDVDGNGPAGVRLFAVDDGLTSGGWVEARPEAAEEPFEGRRSSGRRSKRSGRRQRQQRQVAKKAVKVAEPQRKDVDRLRVVLLDPEQAFAFDIGRPQGAPGETATLAETTVGRHGRCHVVVDPVFADVSKLHCAFTWRLLYWQSSFFVEDRGSRFGTFVNGVRCPAAGSAAVAINVGDIVRLGKTATFVVCLPLQGEASDGV